MTTEKEIRELIDWAKSQGATVTHKTEEESGRLWTVSVQVSKLKGCGPHPMSAISFAERMRELRALDRKIDEAFEIIGKPRYGMRKTRITDLQF